MARVGEFAARLILEARQFIQATNSVVQASHRMTVGVVSSVGKMNVQMTSINKEMGRFAKLSKLMVGGGWIAGLAMVAGRLEDIAGSLRKLYTTARGGQGLWTELKKMYISLPLIKQVVAAYAKLTGAEEREGQAAAMKGFRTLQGMRIKMNPVGTPLEQERAKIWAAFYQREQKIRDIERDAIKNTKDWATQANIRREAELAIKDAATERERALAKANEKQKEALALLRKERDEWFRQYGVMSKTLRPITTWMGELSESAMDATKGLAGISRTHFWKNIILKNMPGYGWWAKGPQGETGPSGYTPAGLALRGSAEAYETMMRHQFGDPSGSAMKKVSQNTEKALFWQEQIAIRSSELVDKFNLIAFAL